MGHWNHFLGKIDIQVVTVLPVDRNSLSAKLRDIDVCLKTEILAVRRGEFGHGDE